MKELKIKDIICVSFVYQGESKFDFCKIKIVVIINNLLTMASESFDFGDIRFITKEVHGVEVLTPVHRRILGEKNERGLYPKKVTWADIVINNVPLEKTYEYEDKFMDIRVPLYNPPEREIMVNERIISEDFEDYDYPEKWVNRMDKIAVNPMTYGEAKKTKKKVKYPVKPKNEYTSEKRNSQTDNYRSIIQ